MPSFEIDYNGTSETVEFLDDLAWGDTQKILKASVDISNPQSISINIQLYQQMVLQAAITKAPFDVKNLTTLNKLPSKVVNKIMGEVMKVFPLETLVQPWVTAMTGQDSIESLMKSMSTVP
jgi:hypothetical protein